MKRRKLFKRTLTEALDFTEKYDDDSALKGKQSELPDDLQKGIIAGKTKDEDAEGEEEDEEQNEGTSYDNMPADWQQILGDCLDGAPARPNRGE
jgi:hypothetical protein